MSNITIRQAIVVDVPLILQFIRELAEYEKLAHEVIADESILKETLFGKDPKAHVIFAEIEGEAIGFALHFYNFSTFLGRPGIYIEDLYIRADYRGQGAGKKLLGHLAQKAIQEGCGRLEWWVLDWNKSSIEFYKSLYAKPMDDWTVYRLEGENLIQVASRYSFENRVIAET